MSYRNPRQFIDTSTAKHFERLQQNISGSFASFAKVYGDSYAKAIKEERERIKANEAAISKRNAKIEDDANKIRLDQAKVKANNPAISFQDLNTEVDLFSDLQTRIDSNLITDPKERSKANQRIISIKALPEQFRGGLENLISVGQDFSERRSLINQPGGFYGGANSRLFEDFGVISNQLTGSVKTQYKYLEDTNVYETGFVITPEGKEPQYYSDVRLRELVNSRDGSMVTIPDETKDFITMRDSVRGYNEDSEVKEFPKSLLIGEEYQEVIDGELVTFRNVNPEAAEKKVNAQLDANVDGDAFTDWERVAFFNTQIDPNNPLIHPDSTDFDRDINNKRFSEGYKEYFIENFVPKRIALNRRRLSQKELDARAGVGAEKNKIDISYIKDLKIPVQSGPPLESGQRPVDLDELENQLNTEGFRVTKSEEVGTRGVNKITITKSIDGADNQVVISEEMTPQDIKRNLELVETGRMPVKVEDEDFSLYKINQ